MDYGLSSILYKNKYNWLYSGQDDYSFDVIVNAELHSTENEKNIRIILAFEEMSEKLMPLLSRSGRLKGIVPTYGCNYFPINSNTQPEENINRLLQMMRLNGINEDNINKVNAYIIFLRNLERIITGRMVPFDITLVYKYSTISSVEHAIADLYIQKKITLLERLQMVERYSEVKNSGPVLENFLSVLNNTFYLNSNRKRRISRLNPGDIICFMIKNDFSQPQIEQLLQMISWDALESRRKGIPLTLSIFEGRRKYGKELINLVSSVAGSARISFYARDFYSGHNSEWQDEIGSIFDAWIFSFHASMSSCEKISNEFGTVPIVRNSYSCDRDRRLENNRLIDRLFNTNRIDHYIEHVPSWEPEFRKEEIHAMSSGTCLIKAENESFMVRV